MNLFLGLLWLLGGVALLAYQWWTQDRRFTIRGTNLSFAWPLLVLALYNFVRWWGIRSFQAHQRTEQMDPVRHRLGPPRAPREPTEAPDPTFNFTDAPHTPPPHDAGGQPPPPP